MYLYPYCGLLPGMYAHRMPEKSLNAAVASELDQMRREARMSQHELADMAGIPRVSVQRYLAGARPIKLDDLALMAEALGGDPGGVLARATARMHLKD